MNDLGLYIPLGHMPTAVRGVGYILSLEPQVAQPAVVETINTRKGAVV